MIATFASGRFAKKQSNSYAVIAIYSFPLRAMGRGGQKQGVVKKGYILYTLFDPCFLTPRSTLFAGVNFTFLTRSIYMF